MSISMKYPLNILTLLLCCFLLLPACSYLAPPSELPLFVQKTNIGGFEALAGTADRRFIIVRGPSVALRGDVLDSPGSVCAEPSPDVATNSASLFRDLFQANANVVDKVAVGVSSDTLREFARTAQVLANRSQGSLCFETVCITYAKLGKINGLLVMNL